MTCQLETKMKFLNWLKNNWGRAVGAICVGTLMYGLLNLAIASILFVFEKLCKTSEWVWLGLDVIIWCAFIYWTYNHIINIDIEPKEKN